MHVQEPGERDHQAEDAVHEQQGCTQEDSGRRQQGVPGVRLRRPGMERNTRHPAADGGRPLSSPSHPPVAVRRTWCFRTGTHALCSIEQCRSSDKTSLLLFVSARRSFVFSPHVFSQGSCSPEN